MRCYDVVVMGGGIAGGFLARQLKLARPALEVLLLEAQERIDDYKVGESTVEVAANYMVRRLNLGPYLYQHQLPKNGLRFFFDTKEKDLPLERMSEIGSDHLPYHPSFQLERAALERDLVGLNRALGVQVELGAKVQDFELGAERHRVAYKQGGAPREVACRWLCDASGRRHLLHRRLGLKVTKEARLNTAAVWGRYRSVAGLDAVTDPAFRARVRWTSRHLSTNHLMYDGYWIWFIPLAGDLMSVGVVYDKDRIEGPRTRAEMEAFLDGHRAARDLMRGAVFEDFQTYGHLPFRADQFFSEDRWAVTGEAGAFTDPFYSPGSDFIATANELTTSLVLSDLAGDRAELPARVRAYNAFYDLKYETTLKLYEGLYPTFGSFEVFRLKYALDFHNYYNMVVWPFMADKLGDLPWLARELELAPRMSQCLTLMGTHLRDLAEHLRARGEYHAQNEGRWQNAVASVAHLQPRIGPLLDEELRRGEMGRIFADVLAAVMARRLDREGLARRRRLVDELGFGHVLQLRAIDEPAWAKVVQRIEVKLAAQLRAELPAAGVEGVRLADRERSVEVLGPAPEGPEGARAAARARELWEAEASSLAFAQA